MQVEDVVDRESLQAYLGSLDKDVSLLTARRVAFHVSFSAALNDYWQVAHVDAGKRNQSVQLTVFGANLVLSVASALPPLKLGPSCVRRAYAANSRLGARGSTIQNNSLANLASNAVNTADANFTAAAAANASSAAASASRLSNVDEFWDQIPVLLNGLLLQEGKTLSYFEFCPQLRHYSDWRTNSPDWAFCNAWYDRVLSGKDTYPNMIAPILNEITETDWLGDPGVLNARFASVLAKYQADDAESQKQDASRAAYFDFVEVNREMRAVAFSSDYEAFPDEDSKFAFLSAAHDLRLVFEDWCELARAQLQGRNRPVTAVVATEQILDQLNALERGEAVSLRNLVRLGSNVKRLARDEELPVDLGSSVFEMFNEALEDYGQLVNVHLGGALQALMALRSLELGDLDSAECIVSLKGGLAYIQTLPNDVLLPFDAKSRAIIDHMVSDLEDEESEIEEANTEVARQTRAKRFAEKFGGVSATIREYLLKGQMAAEKGGESVDKAGKWHKRWQTLEKIKEFWDNLPFGDGL